MSLVQPLTPRSPLGGVAQEPSPAELGLCLVVLCHVAHELSFLWPWSVAGKSQELVQPFLIPALCCFFQTLTGEELKLHVSSSNVILFSFNLTTGTIIPSQSGYDLHVSDLPGGNSTEHSVRLTAEAEVKKPNPKDPHVFTPSLLRQGTTWGLSGGVTSSLSCAVGRQGDQ